MSAVDRQRERAPLAEKPNLTDKTCGGYHQASLGRGVETPSMPTQTAPENARRRYAKAASLTGDMIQVSHSRRNSKNVPTVAIAEHKKDPIQAPAHVADRDETKNESVDKISAEELSIGAIAMLWSKETCHTASEIETELLAAFQKRLKACSMDMNKDATLSRQELLKFCDDASIDLPKFWGQSGVGVIQFQQGRS